MVTFPLQAAFKALTMSGSVDKFSISGDCTGSAQTTNGAASASSFQGINGYSTSESASLSLPSCTSTVSVSSGANFLDANFAPLGSTSTSGGYTVNEASAVQLPAAVKVGDAAPIFRVYASYQDSTMTTRTGQVIEGYAIEADTANTATPVTTAIYHTTSTLYDNTNSLVTTEQSFYRINVNGTMSLISLDVKDNTFLSLHLVYTHID